MASGTRQLRHSLLPLAIVAGVLLSDQLLKHWALNSLDDRDIELFWTLQLSLVRNSGTIFGLGGSLGSWIALLGILVLLIFLGLAFAGIRLLSDSSINYLRQSKIRIGIGLLMGGALGNFADRFFRADEGFGSGKVVDFIDLGWWPVFNVADSAITIGIILMVWRGLYQNWKTN